MKRKVEDGGENEELSTVLLHFETHTSHIFQHPVLQVELQPPLIQQSFLCFQTSLLGLCLSSFCMPQPSALTSSPKQCQFALGTTTSAESLQIANVIISCISLYHYSAIFLICSFLAV